MAYTPFRTGDPVIDRNLDSLQANLNSLQKQVVSSSSGTSNNFVITSSSGAFTTTSVTPVTILASPSIKTLGGAVDVRVQSDGTGNAALLGPSGSPGATSTYIILRDGLEVSRVTVGIFVNAGTSMTSFVPASSLSFLDVTASAGSHVYTLRAFSDAGTTTTFCQFVKLVVRES